MRSPDQLLHSRARVRQRYALMPLEGFPASRLPHWRETEARVLAAPALGAQFVQYLMNIKPSGGAQHRADGQTETFIYLLDGAIHLALGDRRSRLSAGGFALITPRLDFSIEAVEPTNLLLLRKRFEPAADVQPPSTIVGSQSDVPADPWMNNPGTRLQTLIPDELQYDLAMNIFTFDPGQSLPYVETHVMEHGLYFMQGKGMYMLGDEWMEVEKDDFIWMGPYCPQCFYATGPTPSRYIYYKNVNREISL